MRIVSWSLWWLQENYNFMDEIEDYILLINPEFKKFINEMTLIDIWLSYRGLRKIDIFKVYFLGTHI